jgi:hypothetical protein
MTASTPQAGMVVFQSFASNCRVLLQPEQPAQYTPSGALVSNKIPEKVAQFRKGRFVADQRQADKLGFGSVDELVERLRTHSGHRDNTDEPGAEFFEVPNDVAAPDPQKDLQTVAMLAAQQDYEALERVLREEREGWGRQVILDAAESTLVLMREGAVEGE